MLFLRQPLHTASGGSALDLVLGPRPRKQSLSGVWLDFIVEGKGIMSHRLSLKLSSRKSKPNVIASFQRWWASASVPGGGGVMRSRTRNQQVMAAGITGHQILSARHRAYATSSPTEALGKKRLSRASVPWI